jgi:amino acid adenylation domain-containing protein
MLGHFCHLLEAVTLNSARRLSELALMAEDERRSLVACWSIPEKTEPEDRCIHHLLEAQAARTPDAIALSDEDRSLTYRELNGQANRLAHYLRKRGVRVGDLIPIFMERRCEMVIAALGVLKAGAAYVPVDYQYPRLRIEYMLKDTGATLLLTTARCLERLPAFAGDTLCVDRDHGGFEREPATDPVWARNPADLAYVAYTSGSTGTPKGALIQHRGVVRYCRFLGDHYQLNGTDTVLQLASFSFDASFRDMIAPLTAGARVVLLGEDQAKDPTLLISKMKRHRVTCLLSAVPPMLNALAEAMLAEKASGSHSLRMILVSGEPLHGSLCQKVSEAFGEQTLLVNQYGPTECTMTSSYHRSSPIDFALPIAPIGRPVPHANFYVLDAELNPAPMDIEGELFIGGEGLAAGYLRLAVQTAESFGPHPYSDRPGDRLYRTGDIVRCRADGTFAFVGRRDGQVKIRSIRIELGEIESVLSRHEAVREVAVLAREDHPGEKRLVAYVAATDEAAAGPAALRAFLGQHLPEYMIPSFFVFLPSLPRTPNGKLDRKALPPPDLGQRATQASFVAPRTAVEKSLAVICRELLRIDKVGVHDNFFDLGLHSLSATQLVSRVRTRLHVKVPLRQIFEAPTIAGFASLIEKRVQANEKQRTSIVPMGESEAIPKRVRNDSRRAQATDEGRTPVAIERRPLLSLIAAGKIAPVDSVALSYLSEDALERMGLAPDSAISDWFDDLPCVFGIYETHLGRIAVIGLPRLRSQIYDDQQSLIAIILEALEISQRIGGRVVSLTGLIPSATNYGHAIVDALAGEIRHPLVSTGHATTVSTVVLTIERILREGGKSLAEEAVAFVGLGSIGYTTLRLMLHSLPHPKSITLCDLYSKSAHLEKVRDAIIDEFNFAGSVRVVESNEALPKDIYAAGLIVGATNVPNVLDVEQLGPGALIVDDSAPHCFTPERAIRRFEADGDILFTAGGSSVYRSHCSVPYICRNESRKKCRPPLFSPWPSKTPSISAGACFPDCSRRVLIT